MNKKQASKIMKTTVKAKAIDNPQAVKMLPNHIDEYFVKIEGNEKMFHSRELFKASPEDVDIKTDLSLPEIVTINKINWDNEFLRKHGLEPVWTGFLNKYMRLKISLDRKSRKEFVDINKSDKTDEAISLASNIQGLTGNRK